MFTLIFNGLKMGKVFKCNTWLLILDPKVRLWNEKLKRLRENEKKQTITISIAAGNYDTEIIIDLINRAIQDFRVKYQESSIGFEILPIFSPLKISVNGTWPRISAWRFLKLWFIYTGFRCIRTESKGSYGNKTKRDNLLAIWHRN